MKSIIILSSIGNIKPNTSYNINVAYGTNAKINNKSKVKIRNNPKRKGRVYND